MRLIPAEFSRSTPAMRAKGELRPARMPTSSCSISKR
jgi:hypothetical protein